jgi:hypothetical protein
MKKNMLLSLLFISLASQTYGQGADSFQWLTGTWQLEVKGGYILERWVFTNDSTLLGKSVFIKATSDTIPQESLKLVHQKGSWTYTSTVIGQNNNQPVSFNVIFEKPLEFIALNPAHDFPQRIAYRRIGSLLYASIEGRKNGKYGKQNFDFVRVTP